MGYIYLQDSTCIKKKCWIRDCQLTYNLVYFFNEIMGHCSIWISQQLSIWKERLNSDGQQFHQDQQNEL